MKITNQKNGSFQRLGIPEKSIPTFANQVHSATVSLVEHDSGTYLPHCDGLLTKTPSRPLCLMHADCQIAFFYDPKTKSVAGVHSGWRGSVQNIYKETIAGLSSHFGSRPEDLYVCISPSLGPNHAQFIHYRKELPEDFWQFQEQPDYFNFWKISKWQLENEGSILPRFRSPMYVPTKKKSFFTLTVAITAKRETSA